MMKLNKYILNLVQKVRILFYKSISDGVDSSGNPNLVQPLLLCGNGRITWGEGVYIGYFPSPFFLSSYAHFDLRGKNASITIESGVYINNSSTIIADNASVQIKQRTLIGTNLTIYTSDFHSIDPEKRDIVRVAGADVTIEENVFIGSDVTILKGVKIGKNSVIANGSIVSSNIEENCVAAGIPCRVIKKI